MNLKNKAARQKIAWFYLCWTLRTRKTCDNEHQKVVASRRWGRLTRQGDKGISGGDRNILYVIVMLITKLYAKHMRLLSLINISCILIIDRCSLNFHVQTCSRCYWSLIKSEIKYICSCLLGTIIFIYVAVWADDVHHRSSGLPGVCRYSKHDFYLHLSGLILFLLRAWEKAQDQICPPMLITGSRGRLWALRWRWILSSCISFWMPLTPIMEDSCSGNSESAQKWDRPKYSQFSSAIHLVFDLGKLVNIFITVMCKW